MDESQGYDSKEIVEKVRAATEEVRAGRAAYERDSVLFTEPNYSWPVLSSLLYLAARNQGRLNVIDFGGSLGSTYFQHRPLLKSLAEICWNVVEQPIYVTAGEKQFQDQNLRFYSDLKSCLKENQPHALLFSGVLQYLEKPYELLKEAIKADPPVIILDRTCFSVDNQTHLTIQRVSPRIYPASYPCWFLSKKKVKNLLTTQYQILAEFTDPLDSVDHRVSFAGWITVRKDFLYGSK